MVDQLRTRHLLAGLEGIRHRLGDELVRRASADAVRLRGADGRILDLLGDQGARPSELVDGAWISKQAVGKRIRELEARGLVEVEPDPHDGRAVVVSRTELGDRTWAAAMAAIADLERDLASQVGEQRYAIFRSVLDELAAGYVPGPDRVKHSGHGAP